MNLVLYYIWLEVGDETLNSGLYKTPTQIVFFVSPHYHSHNPYALVGANTCTNTAKQHRGMNDCGALDDSDYYFYEDIVAALESWFQTWHTFRESHTMLFASGQSSSNPEMAIHSSTFADGKDDDDERPGQVVPWNSHYSEVLESFAANVRDRWAQHLEDEEREELQRRRFLKQESMSTLEIIGVGSSDHLSGLSLEQLQEMQAMVHQHDSKYWQDSDHRVLPLSLDWLDTLCA